MTRRIQKGNALSLCAYRICADGLSDTARLLIRHIRLTDGVKKRSLTMVYMPHHADNRRTRHHSGSIFFLLPKKLLNNVNLYLFFTDDFILDGNIFRLLKGNVGVYGNNLPLQKELFDDCGRLNLHLVSQLPDCQGLRKGNNLNLFFLGLLRLLLGFDKSARLIAALYCRLIFLIDMILP